MIPPLPPVRRFIYVGPYWRAVEWARQNDRNPRNVIAITRLNDMYHLQGMELDATIDIVLGSSANQTMTADEATEIVSYIRSRFRRGQTAPFIVEPA